MKLALIFLFIMVMTFLISGFCSGTWDIAAMDMDIKIGSVMTGITAMVFTLIFRNEV